MTTRIITTPAYFGDPSIGRPIANGKIYIGIVDGDPELPEDQIDVYAQEANGDMSPPLPQPIRTTIGGMPVYNGFPVLLLINGQSSYSILIKDDSGATKFYSPDAASSPAEPAFDILPIAKGGTNSNVAIGNGKAMRSSAGKIQESIVTIDDIGRLHAPQSLQLKYGAYFYGFSEDMYDETINPHKYIVSKLAIKDYVDEQIAQVKSEFLNPPTALFRYTLPEGTAGGPAVVGWQTQPLNTEVYNYIDATLSNNEIGLYPGIYETVARFPANNVTGHRIRLYNVTTSTPDPDLISPNLGTSTEATTIDQIGNLAAFSGRLTVPGEIGVRTQYKVDHYVAHSFTKGWGNELDAPGTEEQYGHVEIKLIELDVEP